MPVSLDIRCHHKTWGSSFERGWGISWSFSRWLDWARPFEGPLTSWWVRGRGEAGSSGFRGKFAFGFSICSFPWSSLYHLNLNVTPYKIASLCELQIGLRSLSLACQFYKEYSLYLPHILLTVWYQWRLECSSKAHLCLPVLMAVNNRGHFRQVVSSY